MRKIPSFGENFEGYKVDKLKLENAVFPRLDFLAKFFELNRKQFKEFSFQNVKILKDVYSGIEDSFCGKNLRLRVINLEATNISKLHLIKLVKECQYNDSLYDLSLT